MLVSCNVRHVFLIGPLLVVVVYLLMQLMSLNKLIG